MQTYNGIFGPGGHGGGIFQTTVAGLGSYDTKQGIFGPGGHGGGIFQTTVSGLGNTDVGPRGVYDEKTLSLQISANAVLPRIGKNKIKEDGILGDETCGAIKAIVANGSFSGWKIPIECTAIATYSYSSSQQQLDQGYEADTGLSTGVKIAIAGAAVLAIVGGYVAWRKIR